MFLLLILLSIFSSIVARDFNQEWYTMQEVYHNLIRQLPSNYHDFTVSEWKKFQAAVASTIQKPPTQNFLTYHPIAPAMVRFGFGRTQQFELNYLTHALSPKNKAFLDGFKDAFFGGLTTDCPGKSFSSNALGQLFYFANILEQINYEKINTMIELGGGFGSLCYIAKSLIPSLTYIIIDLPEMLALQHLYLRLSLTETEIEVHTMAHQPIKPGAINLVPIFFIQNIQLPTDVFTSNFALSECPSSTQQLIIDKNFFNAQVCFIVGQADGWGPTNSWHMPKHHNVMNAVKRLFTHSFTTMYHNFDGPICSYQILAVR